VASIRYRHAEKVLKALKRKAKGEDPRYGPTAFPGHRWRSRRAYAEWEGGDGKRSGRKGRQKAAARSGSTDAPPSFLYLSQPTTLAELRMKQDAGPEGRTSPVGRISVSQR